MTTSDNIRSNLMQLIEPIRDQLDALDNEIAQAEQNLAVMRQTRRDTVRALSVIDPTFVTATEQKPKPKSPRPESRTKISSETLTSVRDWIVDHRTELNTTSFSAAGLRRRDDWGLPFRQQPTVEALKRLHEEGLLRLDSTGVAGSRYYKVVG
jgi:hypothetical protein